ncbi:MAG: metal-dependent hydrolase [Parasporobacterium sp.]|nr:metal-dependent hydrolase [Parasporobacterium sp.]
MMGYTHAVIGAGGALSLAAISGDESPEFFMMASVAGIIGGVAVDIDVKDNFNNPKVTDALRTRLFVIGNIGLWIILDLIMSMGITHYILSRRYLALIGVIMLAIVLLIGFVTKHRTFSHSLLFVLLSSVAIYFIIPYATMFYLVGAILHLFFDMFNNQVHHHGIWLLYPLKTGKGIALGVCKSGRLGNKILYFLGLIFYIIVSVYYLLQIEDRAKMIAPIIMIAYVVVFLHFVRRKSEKEQRHIMHMNGEL